MLLRHVGNNLFSTSTVFLTINTIYWDELVVYDLNHNSLCCWLDQHGQDILIFLSCLNFLVLHRVVMHNCCWDQPKSIHMHRKIHSCLIPSSRPHEDDSRVDLGLPFLWERGSQFPCRPWHASGCDRHDLVWERIVETWRERAPGLLNTKRENSEARDTVRTVRAWSEGLKWEQRSHRAHLEHRPALFIVSIRL